MKVNKVHLQKKETVNGEIFKFKYRGACGRWGVETTNHAVIVTCKDCIERLRIMEAG